MALPTTKSSVANDMHRLFWLVYGSPKIGKSTFASGFPNALFLTTEDAHRHLSVFNAPIKNWPDFLAKIKEAATTKEGAQFKTVVVDTVSLLFQMCRDYVFIKKHIEHESDEGFGKAYDYVRMEFMRGILPLTKMGKGLVFICHQKEAPIKARGIELTKICPDLPKGCFTVINPLVDIICYCGFKEGFKGRVAIFEPTEVLDAGDRTHMFSPFVPLSYGNISKDWASGPHGGVGLRESVGRVSQGIKKPQPVAVAAKKPVVAVRKPVA